MNYVIKSPREGWYLTEYQHTSGKAAYGKIKDAKVYCSREEATRDLEKLRAEGHRVVAFTKKGICKPGEESTKRSVDRYLSPRIKKGNPGLSFH